MVTKRFDKASPILVMKALTGTLMEALVTFRRKATRFEYLKIKLLNVRIVSITNEGNAVDSSPVEETMVLVPSMIEYVYQQQKEDGTPEGNAITADVDCSG